MKIVIEPAERATAKVIHAVAHFMGWRKIARRDPGACAPGFMLTPASQANCREVRV